MKKTIKQSIGSTSSFFIKLLLVVSVTAYFFGEMALDIWKESLITQGETQQITKYKQAEIQQKEQSMEELQHAQEFEIQSHTLPIDVIHDGLQSDYRDSPQDRQKPNLQNVEKVASQPSRYRRQPTTSVGQQQEMGSVLQTRNQTKEDPCRYTLAIDDVGNPFYELICNDQP